MFKNKGQPFGDIITVKKKYAVMPKLLKSGWVWRKDYYEVTRSNSYVPPQYRHEYEEEIFLSEEDLIIFKLSHSVDLTFK